jgi:hypothetical protein
VEPDHGALHVGRRHRAIVQLAMVKLKWRHTDNCGTHPLNSYRAGIPKDTIGTISLEDQIESRRAVELGVREGTECRISDQTDTDHPYQNEQPSMRSSKRPND